MIFGRDTNSREPNLSGRQNIFTRIDLSLRKIISVIPTPSMILDFLTTDAADQALADEQVLDTEAEGIFAGSMKASIYSTWDVSITSGYIYTSVINYSIHYRWIVGLDSFGEGQLLVADITAPSVNGSGSAIAVDSQNSVRRTDVLPIRFYRTSGATQNQAMPYKALGSTVTDFEVIADTNNYQLGMLRIGNDVHRLIRYPGDANFTLLDIIGLHPGDDLYPIWAGYGSNVHGGLFRMRVLSDDFSSAINPVYETDWTEFTQGSTVKLNGQNGWIGINGTDAASQTVNNNVVQGTGSQYDVKDLSISDGVVEVQSASFGTGSAAIIAMGRRKSDDHTKGWEARQQGGTLYLKEDGVDRGTIASAPAAGSTGRVRLYMRGDKLRAEYMNDTTNYRYSTPWYQSSSYQTETKHGLFMYLMSAINFRLHKISNIQLGVE